MSHAHIAHCTRFAVVAACVAAASAPLRADDPPATVGTLRTVPVVSVSLAVGSTEKESKRVVYAPPPGWYVRSHRVVCAQKTGIVNYVVNTVPAGFNWLSDERTAAATKANASALVAIPQTWAGGQAAAAQNASSADHQENTSSHHVLVVDVSARGHGFLQGGATVELTVFAEMVYLGK